MELFTNLYFWGESYENVINMFDLDDIDLKKSILDCMGPPSSFTPLARKAGQKVVSCSDVYGSNKEALEEKVPEILRQTLSIIGDNPDRFVGSAIGTTKEYSEKLKSSLDIFFKTYNDDFKEDLYSSESLPVLNDFNASEFGLVICRHFLFKENANFTVDFHVRCIKEMCRVAKECRIFPLVGANSEPAKILPEVMKALQDEGVDVEVRKVSYELRRNANAMLRVWKS